MDYYFFFNPFKSEEQVIEKRSSNSMNSTSLNETLMKMDTLRKIWDAASDGDLEPGRPNLLQRERDVFNCLGFLKTVHDVRSYLIFPF